MAYELPKHKELMELIYEKLAGNDNYKQFEPEMADDMCLIDHREDYYTIEIEFEGKNYELSIKEQSSED